MSIAAAALLFLTAQAPTNELAPVVDHHQHLFSPAAGALASGISTLDARQLVALLDAAGIRRAVVLSVAYQFANPNRPAVQDEYAKVRAENDWTSEQVGQFPDRLVAFCGLNPLKDYALTELARCATDSHLYNGLKLHFGNSDVDLDNGEHVQKLRMVFRAANQHGMAILVHLRPSVTMKRPYGAAQARVFLNEVLPAAPDVPVEIAHLASAGSYDDPSVDEALSVFVDAIAQGDARTAHVYFDVSGFGMDQWKQHGELVVTRIRQLGLRRMLYGTDGGIAPRTYWAAFRTLPLSESEFRTIAGNIAPYLR